MAQAYCVKDKQKVEIKNPQNITMKNGKPAIRASPHREGPSPDGGGPSVCVRQPHGPG
jgi:hypothetical protein